MLVSAVFINRLLISSGVKFIYFCLTSRAEPATIGAAPEVPLNAEVPVAVPTSAETEPPGAPISGLIMPEAIAGPRDEDPTIVPTSEIVALGSMVAVTLGNPCL